ncbi:MAG: hypothetical protein WA532_10840 [Candidatus Korobacteraceae bacterium]
MASPRPSASAAPAAGEPAYNPALGSVRIDDTLLALVGSQRAINLAELTRAVAADRNLSNHVTQAACQEFGWPWLTVEQAIVLLGRERLAGQILRFLHINRNPPAERLPLPELLQGISE